METASCALQICSKTLFFCVCLFTSLGAVDDPVSVGTPALFGTHFPWAIVNLAKIKMFQDFVASDDVFLRSRIQIFVEAVKRKQRTAFNVQRITWGQTRLWCVRKKCSHMDISHCYPSTTCINMKTTFLSHLRVIFLY